MGSFNHSQGAREWPEKQAANQGRRSIYI